MSISMQISSTIPANNSHIFQVRRASFKCRQSTLNPSTKTLIPSSSSSSSLHYSSKRVTSSTELTRLHLLNLENLLQQSPEPNQHDPQEANKVSDNGSMDKKGGLNLARIWPEMKAAEEMSPRHLNRLKRLLSKKPEYSPRNNLGSRWREYHGCNDWVKLLDPLDENLRREVVRYGEFVQAAYHVFHSDPAMSADEPPLPRKVALPDRSYKVTKSLYATSSVGLPNWVDDVAPELGWMTQRSSWVGYVAVCEDMSEIQRMGRRDIVIALRGTATCLEWAENVRTQLVQIPGSDNLTKENPKVERGFLSLFKTRGAHVSSLAESIVEEIRRLMELYEGETLSITVTGHSLGAALALLVAEEVSSCAPDVPPVAVFSFGGPRVGNRDFANRINAQNVKVLRIVNNQDVITRVPGVFTTNNNNKLEVNTMISRMLNVLDKSNPWSYSHVGAELRVDTRMSPYLKPNADVACCHDLEAYLHLVDGFMASNCPFRENAKRSLWKLLNEQKSNVKKLYTRKAKGLSLNFDRNGMSMPSCLSSPS